MTTPEEIIDAYISGVRMFRLDRWEAVRALCESPIEELFLSAVFAAGIDSPLGVHIYGAPYRENIDLFDGDHVWPQAVLGKYRVDFLFISQRGKRRRFVIVECDGHDFHERTKLQAARDKARDRHFASEGMTVLRFTGSEIHRDPIACWTETLNVLWEARSAA